MSVTYRWLSTKTNGDKPINEAIKQSINQADASPIDGVPKGSAVAPKFQPLEEEEEEECLESNSSASFVFF